MRRKASPQMFNDEEFDINDIEEVIYDGEAFNHLNEYENRKVHIALYNAIDAMFKSDVKNKEYVNKLAEMQYFHHWVITWLTIVDAAMLTIAAVKCIVAFVKKINSFKK